MLSLPFCSCRAALHCTDLLLRCLWQINLIWQWQSKLELGRYRYLESVSVLFHVGSVFGIGILKYWLKIAHFWYPTGLHRRKLEWWGHHAMKKYDSEFGRFDISKWQIDTARQQRLRYGLHRTVNIYAFSHYVVLIVCFCYTLLKRLFGLIHHRKRQLA